MFFGLNDVGFLGSLQPPALLLLDAFPNAAAAYSLRQLRTGVANVVRVRRSSDNTEDDFTAAQVSDGTLATWVGAGNNGFVRTWYDQSGNSRNAEQTTTANQPQIVSSGNLLTDNSKPCLQFNGSNTSLDDNALASVFSGTNVFLSAATVCKSSTTSSSGNNAAAWGFGRSVDNDPLRWLGQDASSALARLDERSGGSLTTTGGAVNNQALIWANSNTISQVLRVNGAQVGTALGSGLTLIIDRFSIGCLSRIAKVIFWNGIIQEVVFYQSNQAANAAAIESNINTHYSIY
jgi:hypothetical protein